MPKIKLNFCVLTTLILSTLSPIKAKKVGELEGRIYAGAEVRSIVTLHPRFEHLLFTLRGCYVKVLQTAASSSDEHKDDHRNFVWNSGRMTLENTKIIDRPLGSYFRLGVGAYCPNNSHHLWLVTVYISQINKYPPQFSKKMYSFKVSPSAKVGESVGNIKAEDQDTVIYNSKIHYRLVTYVTDNRMALNEETGELRLMVNMKEIEPKSLSILIVEACDYGSPQKCTSAEVEVLRVSLTSPLNVRVLTANPRYQVTCWEAPQLGSPEVYFLRIINERANATRPQYRMDVKSSKTGTECAITHEDSSLGERLSMLISANTTDDQSTSEPVPFIIDREFKCDGECHGKGTPYCLNGTKSGRPEQATWNGEKYCMCEMTYEGPSCATIKKCRQETVKMPYGLLTWSPTPVGAKTGVVCPYGPIGLYINRYCLFDVSIRKATWETLPETNDCVTRSHLLDYLSTFTMVINSKNGSTSLNTAKLITERIEHLLASALLDYEVANAVVQLADNLAASSPLQQVENAHLTNKLRGLINNYAKNVILPTNQTWQSIKSKNIYISITQATNGSELLSSGVAKEFEINIAEQVFDQVRSKFIDEPQRGTMDKMQKMSNSSKIQISIIRHKTQNFYPTIDSRVIKVLPVVEIFVKGLQNDFHLSGTISFTINPEKYGAPVNFKDLAQNPYICTYWDEKTSKWSRRGVTTTKRITGGKFLVVCKTSHLTGFSILLDFQQKTPIDEENQFVLNLLSWIGCTCSIIGLVLTLITYAIFRYLNREKAVKILMNLCFSMLLMNAVFLISSLRPYLSYSPKICISVGMLLHYVTLSTLLWMGVEALNMHSMLVNVFVTSERHFMLKRFILAWGLPLLVVGITGGLNIEFYFHSEDKYCRLSPLNTIAHYAAFLGPACLILVFNCVVFIFVLRVLSLSSDTKRPIGPGKGCRSGQLTKSTSLTMQPLLQTSFFKIRGALSVMVLLGITWVFGAFAVGPARLPFMYVFCVLNSSQGFVIFLVRCLLYDETRGAWLLLLSAGKLKRFKGKPCISTRSTNDPNNNSSGNGAGSAHGRRVCPGSSTCCALHRSQGSCHQPHASCNYWPPAKKCAAPRRPPSTCQSPLKSPITAVTNGSVDSAIARKINENPPNSSPVLNEMEPLMASTPEELCPKKNGPAGKNSLEKKQLSVGIKYIDETPSSTPIPAVRRTIL